MIIWGKIYGQENPWLSADLGNLGLCYERLQDHGDAELSFRRALRNDEKGLPPDSTDLAADSYNLGFLYYLTKHFQEADPLLKRALDIQTKALGLTNPDAVQTAQTYANVLRLLHREQEAQQLESKLKAAGPAQ